jgi:hypothetical protein
MRLIARPYIFVGLFALILAHVCVHAARAQCSSGYCPRPAAPVTAFVPAPVAILPAPVLYRPMVVVRSYAAPVPVVRYRVVRRPLARLFRRPCSR